MAQSFEPTSLELGKFLDDPTFLVLENNEFTLNYVCTHEDFTEAYTNPNDPEAANEMLDRLQGEIILGAGETQVLEALPVGASCEVTEEEPDFNQPGWDWTQERTTNRAWDDAAEIAEEPEPVILEAGMIPQFIAIVNRYRIGDREVSISKITAGPVEEGTTYTFEYSTDDGATWTAAQIRAGDEFLVEAPVINSDGTPFQLRLREVLEPAAPEVGPPHGPKVSWAVTEEAVDNTYTNIDGTWYASTNIEMQPVDPAVPTPLAVSATNSYAQVELKKSIPGLSVGGSIDTTLLTYGAETMTIRYEVNNTGPVDLNAIELFDTSLNNNLFTLPEGVNVDPTTGQVSGHNLTFDAEGRAFWELMVTLNSPDQDFHYEAEQAGATVNASSTIENRTIAAQASDRHGALRLLNFEAMLPATGVTTLVWVLGLGLLVALAALVLYIRSRR